MAQGKIDKIVFESNGANYFDLVEKGWTNASIPVYPNAVYGNGFLTLILMILIYLETFIR